MNIGIHFIRINRSIRRKQEGAIAMPLSEAEKIDVRVLLRLTSGPERFPGGKSSLDILDERLAALNATEVVSVQAILVEFASVKYESGRLQGEYEHDPARQRELLRRHLITVLNFNPSDYQAETTVEFLKRGN
jgi:hypothetical protein